MPWEEEIAVAREAAQAAGETLNKLFGRVNRVTKKGQIDLVTEADVQAEKAVLDIITAHFPRDSILTEEAGEQRHLPERVWHIDPLDGTTNFAHAFPVFAVSIALEVEKEVVLGVVYNPYADEFFEAVTGMGAFLNKNRIRVSQVSELGEALLATGFPYDIHKRPRRVLAPFEELILLAQGVRRPGSAAIDLCYVAAGRFDGFWEPGLKPWDTAGGSIIVSEAGGKLSTYEGEEFTPYQRTVVASNTRIHDALRHALNSALDGESPVV
jgi:myo-inositol-1(or 4)-monophosphatase